MKKRGIVWKKRFPLYEVNTPFSQESASTPKCSCFALILKSDEQVLEMKSFGQMKFLCP